MQPFVDYAMQALRTGLCVMPASTQGDKKPLGNSKTDHRWKHFQEKLPTETQIQTWYKDDTLTNIGFITGKVSGNLEVMDFDDMDTYHQFKEAALACGLAALVTKIESGYLEHSPRGVHWFYRCKEIEGNQKLASRLKTPEEMKDKHDKIKGLIETRGEKGYIIAAPSEGPVNPAGKYTLVAGSLATIATISKDERQELFRLARTFDTIPKRIEKATFSPLVSTGDLPGELFAAQTSWADILEPHGWKRCFTDRQGVTYWTRPGKVRGISASTNYGDSDYLYIWSTNTSFDAERGYSKFAAYTFLNYGGDFEEAARVLAEKGFTSTEKMALPKFCGIGARGKEEITAELEAVASSVTFLELTKHEYPEPQMLCPILPVGVTILGGSPKIGKSWLALEMLLCAVSDGKRALFNQYQMKPVECLYLALEDNKRRIKDRILKLSKPPLNFARHVPPTNKLVFECGDSDWPKIGQGCMERLEKHLELHPKCGFIVVDTLQMVRPKPKKGMTAYEMDYEVISVFQQFAIKHNIAILLITHLRKSFGGREEDPFEQVTGSMGLTGAADCGIVLKKGISSGRAEMYIRGRDVEERTLILEFVDGFWSLLGEVDGSGSIFSKYQESILECLLEAGKPLKPSEINRWLEQNEGRKDTNIRRTMLKMFERDTVQKDQYGRYSARPGAVFASSGKAATGWTVDHPSIE